jgi:hypothetical protein
MALISTATWPTWRAECLLGRVLSLSLSASVEDTRQKSHLAQLASPYDLFVRSVSIFFHAQNCVLLHRQAAGPRMFLVLHTTPGKLSRNGGLLDVLPSTAPAEAHLILSAG